LQQEIVLAKGNEYGFLNSFVLFTFGYRQANIMETLLIHPQDSGQLEQIKAYLISLKVAFEVKVSALPPHVIEGIERGVAEDDAGQTISFDEFRQKHFLSSK
jgi:hypothetical protein